MADQNSSDWSPKMVICIGTVVLQENRALFVRQAKGHSLEGQWSIPWGLIDSDESPETTALRETQEEGGIIAEIEGLLGFQNLRRAGWLGLVFLCHHVSGVPTSDGGIETDRAAYFTLDDMEAFNEPFEPWCEWIVRRVLCGEHSIISPELNNPYYPRLAFL